jgi:hypothetical protein
VFIFDRVERRRNESKCFVVARCRGRGAKPIEKQSEACRFLEHGIAANPNN